ncbi:hypothetical protein GOBAR_DD17981 [Gossypium barbadense]|nr:hypothetical protein GOBAR_DD17981 [Gossypium barbadense]
MVCSMWWRGGTTHLFRHMLGGVFLTGGTGGRHVKGGTSGGFLSGGTSSGYVLGADVKSAEDSTPLGEEHRVQDPFAFENLNPGPRLQLHLVVFKTDADGDDGYDNNDPFDHEVEDCSDLDLDEVLDDIDDEDTNNDENVNVSSVVNLIRGVVIHNDPGAHMSLIDRNTTHATEFSEMIRLEVDMQGETNTPFIEWLGTIEPWQWAQSFNNRLATLMPRMGLKQINQMEARNVFVEHVRKAMVMNYWIMVQLRKVPITSLSLWHVVAAYAHSSINAEKFIGKVYTLERTLHVWGNEFPILCDLSTWEVLSPNFKLVLDKGLRRTPKGFSQVTRIRNEMDMGYGKLYGVCRIASYNQSKCSHRTYHIEQSLQSSGN